MNRLHPWIMVIDEGVTEPDTFTDSLIQWSDIGRNGKRFLTDGRDQNEIAEMTGRDALQPIRVIAGYNTGGTLQERAEIATDELERQGGFDRSILIIATPTGTGWLDPAAIQPVAFIHNGDLSIVSMQYSCLPSRLTLMIDPDRSRESAQALFDAVYLRWLELPPDTRPRLYLFSLSLGSLGSEASVEADFAFVRSDQWRSLGRAALCQHNLAKCHCPPQSGITRMETCISRQFAHPVHDT